MTGTRLACGAGGVLLTLATLGAASGPDGRTITATSAATTATAEVPPATASAPRELPAFAPAYSYPISDAQWAKITATGTWRPGCPVGRAGLTNVSVPHFGMDGTYHRGSVTVNLDVAADVIQVFNSLAAQRFPIRQAVPIEHFGGWDSASGRADNTTAFNCRKPSEANAPADASPHANGRAIDINPRENPWIQPRTGAWEPDGHWTGSRRTLANEKYGLVVPGGIVHAIFTKLGWSWSGLSRSRDAMHWDTGYPSMPWRGHRPPSPSHDPEQ
ncbi:MAG TPA: M15 family metallopeptidase [Intrasporangium sp.]|nr:M15 family metallopeptidase [Intrasporangium sp.]